MEFTGYPQTYWRVRHRWEALGGPFGAHAENKTYSLGSIVHRRLLHHRGDGRVHACYNVSHRPQSRSCKDSFEGKDRFAVPHRQTNG